MSTWILLIVMYAGGFDGGVQSQMIEYKTKENCEKALAQVVNDNRRTSRPTVKAVCFEGKLKGGNNGWQYKDR